MRNPTVLVVLDGFGISDAVKGNAIREAKKPNLDYIEAHFPFTTLQASGLGVGLPWGEAGNSEVGHLTMGAGRVIFHHLPRIITAIRDGSFFENPAFAEVVSHVKTNGARLHLLGLASSGSVHSYSDHLWALIELAGRAGITTYLHAITDGKDAPPEEAKTFIPALEGRIKGQNAPVVLASLLGRYFAMDRDRKWDRIQKAYELLTGVIGAPFTDAKTYLEDSYAQGMHDDTVQPAWRIDEKGNPVGRIRSGDGLIIFNFREDSIRELAEAFAKSDFEGFARERISDIRVATLTEYEKGLEASSAFPPLDVSWPLGRAISAAGKRQLRIAETEKYAHVTYFFNCGREEPFEHEDRILVPSLPVSHFDEHPEMRSREITEKIAALMSQYDFILANFANADMIGHTGNFDAAVSAVEALDLAVGRLMAETFRQNGTLLITGDHGNAEQKTNPLTGEPVTEHTANPVPFYLVRKDLEAAKPRSREEIAGRRKETGGLLTDVAPTVLELMGTPKPTEMTGKSLAGLLLERESSNARL